MSEAVEKLYEFRDRYFEQHSLEEALQKNQHVEDKLNQTMVLLNGLQENHGNKAEYLILKGWALNVLSTINPAAEECLSKAVKLDPCLVQGWIQLGESYWKRGDVEGAKNCFSGALNHSTDKVALRNLSMVMRQLSADAEERIRLVDDSVVKAKEAVQCDIQDGVSWYILGNAYFSQFFNGSRSPTVLNQCMSAYQQAERDLIAKNNPDLHFNRAAAYRYQEEYQQALDSYIHAVLLDPTWSEPADEQKKLLHYLNQVADLVHTKGKVRGKKLSTMVSSLRPTDLGVYSGGSYTSGSGQTVTLEQIPLANLKPGINSQSVILGKVVGAVTNDQHITFTFGLVDKASDCVSVTVYNLAPNYGVKVGDSVAIPEPYLQPVDIKYKDQDINYRNIRVENPVVLVVNGRKLGRDKLAPSMLALSNKSD